MCRGPPQLQSPTRVGEREGVCAQVCKEPYRKHPCQGLGVGATQEQGGLGVQVLGPRMCEERGAKRRKE